MIDFIQNSHDHITAYGMANQNQFYICWNVIIDVFHLVFDLSF